MRLFIGAAKIKKYTFPRPSVVTACYAYSVLTRCFSSVYCGAGSETALSKQSKQVVIAVKDRTWGHNEFGVKGYARLYSAMNAEIVAYLPTVVSLPCEASTEGQTSDRRTDTEV